VWFDEHQVMMQDTSCWWKRGCMFTNLNNIS